MTLTDFIHGYRPATLPSSDLDERTRAELDAEADRLHRTTPASKFSKPAKQGTAWRVKLT